MELKPGTQLASTVCATQVVVVRPAAGDVEVTCGGEPMVPADEAPPPPAAAQPAGGDGGTMLGKRYEAPDVGLELLCTKAGAHALAVNGQPLEIKQAKAVPSSD
jgi:hypothetical protein